MSSLEYEDTNGNFFLDLGLILESYAVGRAIAYKQYQNIEKINKQRKQEQFEKTAGKNFDQNVQDVINETKGLDEVIPSQKMVKNYTKTIKKDNIDSVVKNNIKHLFENKLSPLWKF